MSRGTAHGIVKLALLASVGACAAGPQEYRVGALPSGWARVQVHAGDLVFHHQGGGAIAAAERCAPHVEDVPLDVLTNHLLFGVQVQTDSRRTLTLAGRAALDTSVTGTLDGVLVQMELVVLKKDDCTYDLQLVAGPAVFAARRTDFWAFIQAFMPGARAGPPGGA